MADSRVGTGGWTQKFAAGESRALTLSEPESSATALLLNVVVTEPMPQGFLTVYPCGTAAPMASNLNFGGGQTVANAVAVAPRQGAVCFLTSAAAHVVVDEMGWFGSAGLGFVPVDPVRVLDSRVGTGGISGQLLPYQTWALPLGGGPNVPVDAEAVTVNLTLIPTPVYGRYVTLWPCGEPKPPTSTINFSYLTRSILATVKLGTNGTLCVASTSAVDVVLDLSGYYLDEGTTAFAAVDPVRVLDTRYGVGAPSRLGYGETLAFSVAPPASLAGATAVTVNVTVVDPDASGWLEVYPCGTAPPLVSNIDFSYQDTVPNQVTVEMGTEQTVCLAGSTGMNVVADVSGYYLP